MIASTAASALPLPAPLAAARSVAAGDDAALPGVPSEGTGDTADGFLALLAALMQQPAAPLPATAVAVPASGSTAAGTAEGDLPSTSQGTIAATVLDVTFSMAAARRPPPRATRNDAPASVQIGATLRQLFPRSSTAAASAQADAVASPAVSVAPSAPPVVDGVLPAGGQAVVVADIAPAATADTSMVAAVAPLAGDGIDVALMAASAAADAPADPAAPIAMGDAVSTDPILDEMMPVTVVVPRRSDAGVPGGWKPPMHAGSAPAVEVPADLADGPVDAMPEQVAGEALPVEALELPAGNRPTVRRPVEVTSAAVAAMRSSADGASDNSDGAGDRHSPRGTPEATESTDSADSMPARPVDQSPASGTSSLPFAASTTASAAPSRPPTETRAPAEAAAPPREAVDVPVPRGDQATVLLDSADGTERIRVSVRGNTVHATILTESSHHEALASRVEDLRRSLGERGFTDAHVAVRVAPAHAEAAPPPMIAGAATPESRVASSSRSEHPSQDEHQAARHRQQPDDTREQRGRRRHPEEETE